MDVINVNDSIIGIAIDQGIANLGYSVVELTVNDDLNILTSGTIITPSEQELSQRILTIYQTINCLVKEYNANILGCEKLFFSPKQKTGRNKSASIVYTNMATGILYLIAGENNLHIKEFVPGTVKKYVAGHGRAKKEQVQEAVEELVKTLNKNIETEHEADSIAIGITAVKYKKELMLKGLEREEPTKKKSRKRTKTQTKKASSKTASRKKKGEIVT